MISSIVASCQIARMCTWLMNRFPSAALALHTDEPARERRQRRGESFGSRRQRVVAPGSPDPPIGHQADLTPALPWVQFIGCGADAQAMFRGQPAAPVRRSARGDLYLVAVEQNTKHFATLRQASFGNEVCVGYVQRDAPAVHPPGASGEAIGGKILLLLRGCRLAIHQIALRVGSWRN